MTKTEGSWNFPSNNFGEKTGISEAGIETFRGDLFASLAREVCQNSMDAKKESDQPVHVEFELSYVNRADILGVDTLSDTIERCCDFWAEEHDKKAVEFFNKAQKLIANPQIPVLRISDFNTVGVIGATKLQNSPWQNLVKSSGVSNKSGDSGGSFGIGKSAPYAVSQLRTIFYSTFDAEDVRAYQGVSKLATFRNADNETTQGKGYFGSPEQNSPILGANFPFEGYERTKTGTDIFVLGFHEHPEWADEVLKAIIDGYLYSISVGTLTVSVNGTYLNKDTIGSVLEKYKDSLRLAYQYYEVLINDDYPWVTLDVDGLQHISLKLAVQNGYFKRILMARTNGMKIFDQSRFPSSFDFVGICVLQEEVNSYFRAMENPQHTKWEPDRFSDDPDEVNMAKKRTKALKALLNAQVKELTEGDISDEMDAIGAGEFIPALEDADAPEENKKESINDKVAGYTPIETVPYKKVVSGRQSLSKRDDAGYMYDDTNSGTLDVTGDSVVLSSGAIPAQEEKQDPKDPQTKGTTPSNKKEPVDNPDKKPRDAKFEDDPATTDGEIVDKDTHSTVDPQGSSKAPAASSNSSFNPLDKNPQRKAQNFVPLNVRLFVKNAASNQYSLVFTPQFSADDATVSVYIVGEQGRSEAILKDATDSAQNTLQMKGNRIAIGKLTAGQKTSCYFILETKGQFSMEVEVNGYQA